MMKVRFCSWVVGWALIAAAACAEDGAQRFLSGSGLDRLAATDNDLATVSKEFALAWGEFQEKAPEYVQRQVQVWMVEEAINFKKDSEGYASNDFRVRDNCRKLHNLTSRILSMSNRQFPTEVEWNRSVSVLSGLPQEFASQVATRNSIPATIANTLNGTFNS